MDALPRIILLGLDGFPLSAFSSELTPQLWALSQTGGHAPNGGRAAVPSSTYPGFASLLTGRHPAEHGVWCTAINRQVPPWAGLQQVVVPTLLDACRAAGLASAAVLGDHLLHNVLRTESADVRWPPEGMLLPSTPVDVHGYPSNSAVRPHLLRVVSDQSLSFVFGHLNEVDSLGHDFGPMHPRTRAACTETDAIVGELLDALAGDWERTVMIVVSDHDQESRMDVPPVDLMADKGFRSIAEDLWPDGGAALIYLRRSVTEKDATTVLSEIPDVEYVALIASRVLVVGAGPGRLFRNSRYPRRGFHGGPATARTLAIVAGGHPAVRVIAAAIRVRSPELVDWAPAIAALLGLGLSATAGQNLAIV